MLSTLFSEVCGIVVQHCGLCGGKLGNLFEDASRADHRKGEGTKVNKSGVSISITSSCFILLASNSGFRVQRWKGQQVGVVKGTVDQSSTVVAAVPEDHRN